MEIGDSNGSMVKFEGGGDGASEDGVFKASCKIGKSFFVEDKFGCSGKEKVLVIKEVEKVSVKYDGVAHVLNVRLRADVVDGLPIWPEAVEDVVDDKAAVVVVDDFLEADDEGSLFCQFKQVFGDNIWM